MLKFFLCASFFDPLTLLFSVAFQGLHSLPTFGIDLLYAIFFYVSLCLFSFLSQHTRSLSASVMPWSCGAINLQDSQCFELFTDDVKFFAEVKKMEIRSMVKSYQLREWAYVTSMAFQCSLLPTTKE